MRPVYFGVVFWGEKFRTDFLDLCLTSLLSDGNIPCLGDGPGGKFLICTTAEDWRALQDHPAFARLARHLTPEHLPFQAPDENEPKLLAMSRGHRQVAERMFADRALGSFIYPDTVFSDGVVRALRRHAAEGRKVVLAHCPRLANEGFIDALRQTFFKDWAQPQALPARDLIAMAHAHMHSETRMYEWTAPYFGYNPVMVSWKIPDGSGYLFHSLNWAPILVDYSAVVEHDTSTFEQWTIDGDYIHRNFADPAAVHVMTDSDEAALISFTRESDLTYLPLRVQRLQLVPGLGDYFKTLILRQRLHCGMFDALKLDLFKRPVHFHSAEVGRAWAGVERRAANIVAAALSPLSGRERTVLKFLIIFNDGIWRHARWWVLNRKRKLAERAAARQG